MNAVSLAFLAASDTNVIVVVVMALAFLAFLFVFLRFANLYVRSVLTKAGVGLLDMVAMSLRKVSPASIVNARVNIVQARVEDVDKRDLEAHFLAGGNVMRVVRALIAADRAGIQMEFSHRGQHRLGRARTCWMLCAPA